MRSSIPFLRTSVLATPLLIVGGGTRLESLEVQNPNTVQAFIQLFNAAIASMVKLNVTFTVVSATDVFTANAHGMSNGWWLKVFNTGGALPAGMALDTKYYVINATANTFQLSLIQNGAAIDVSDTGSGTNSFSTFLEQSFIVPAGDGTNDGAVSKEWPTGMLFKDGLSLCVTTTRTGSTAQSSACIVNGSII